MLYFVALAWLLAAPLVSAAATPDAAVEMAKREGKLVLYTAMQPEDSTKTVNS